MNTPVIQTEKLVKEFPIASKALREKKKLLHAVNDVSISVPKGGIFGVVGESGCGKSTLGRCLLRMETITSGSVRFQGRDITALSGKNLLPLRRKMQMIFQNPYSSFNPKQKIGSALAEVCKVHKIPQAQENISQLLSDINLTEDVLHRAPGELSGGQLQRLAIARALLLAPDFIVADEPVSALDVSVQAQILNLLMDLREKFSLTMLFISHEMTVVRHLRHRSCDVSGYRRGAGETDEALSNLLHPYPRPFSRRTFYGSGGKSGDYSQGRSPSAIDMPPAAPSPDVVPDISPCVPGPPPLRDVGSSHLVACIWCDPILSFVRYVLP